MNVSILLIGWLQSLSLAGHLDPDTDPRLRSATITAEGYVVRDLPSRDLDSFAAHQFEMGLTFRHDAAKARPWFREATRMYDELWRRGFRDPNLALNRAHARRLSGDLPGAILALNEGLAAARWNRPLQVALEDARSAVAYPTHSDLESICRPVPPASIGTRMSPTEARLIVAVLWLLTCGGVARFVMTRAGWWLGFAGVWLVVLAVLAALWLHDDRIRKRDNEQALVVLAQDVHMRKGNAETFPLRLDGTSKLPRGVEARELTRRGGWIQIRLWNGVIGWAPEKAVLKAGE
jgi:hypothetical protein